MIQEYFREHKPFPTIIIVIYICFRRSFFYRRHPEVFNSMKDVENRLCDTLFDLEKDYKRVKNYFWLELDYIHVLDAN